MKHRRTRSSTRSSSRRRGAFFAPAAGSMPAPFFQPKLRLGAPSDRFEQEADRVADSVVEGGGAPAVQRKADFDTPTYDRRDPSGRLLRKEPPGLTTPTINGTQLPDDFAKAGQLVMDALTPKTGAYDPDSQECRFEDFESKLSANVIVPTEPGSGGWSINIPGADVKDVAVCHTQKSVPVTMTGDPDDKTIFAWVESNEQEHVDDLKKAHQAHLETYFADLLAMRETDADQSQCIQKLATALGNKDAFAARDFLNAVLAAVKARDDGGGHDLKNQVNVKSGCSAIEIVSKTS